MSNTKFHRVKNVIYTLDENGKRAARGTQFPSINDAKKESRRLQIANGGLGAGALRVLDK